jgi:uncharacterized membrane protein YhhN
MNTQRISLLLFWLIAAIYLFADNLGYPYLAMATKPMLLTLLLLYFVSAVSGWQSLVSKAMIAGLFFSFLGDSFLLFDGDLFFMLGLGSFLITHLCYTRAFLHISKTKLFDLPAARKIATCFFVLLLVLLLTYLWTDLGGLRWPVLIYATVISTMGLSAYHLKDRVSNNAFSLIFFGALLFIFSDSMIALDKFKSAQLALPYPRLLIMVPYIVAQYFIVKGVLGRMNHDGY